MSHATLKTYIIGLGLSLACTLTAFWLVWAHVFATGGLYAAVAALAVVQLAVQLVFFLHLGRGESAALNAAALAYAALLVAIVVGGSLWIMTSLNSRMGMSQAQMLQYMQTQDSAM